VNIVVDARWIIPETSGIGIYTRELLARLPRLAPDWQFRVLFRSQSLADGTLAAAGLTGQPNVLSTVLPYGVFAPSGQLKLPLALRRWGCDLYHSPNYMIPYLAFPRSRKGRIRCVTTIHDVIPLIMPDHAPKSRKSRLFPLFVRCLRESVLRSDAVLTVSHASRRDLIGSLRLGEGAAARVQVVYNGVGGDLHSEGRKPIASDPSAARTLLYVGRLDPYKNVVRLVEAFAQVRARVGYPLALTLVGPPDPRYPEAANRARELGVADAVRFTGFVTDAELAEAYRSADLLVHPSRYEGFGLQLIEAMRCGLPVVCTDGGAQPEVAGDAAVVVPAGDTAALATAIEATLASPSRLQGLQRLGVARAAQFNWDTATAQTAAVYRRLLTGG
jgi:glycosyltransferase involved in cell wall biosynthesis